MKICNHLNHNKIYSPQFPRKESEQNSASPALISNPVPHFPADSSSPYKCSPFKAAAQKFRSRSLSRNFLGHNYSPNNQKTFLTSFGANNNADKSFFDKVKNYFTAPNIINVPKLEKNTPSDFAKYLSDEMFKLWKVNIPPQNLKNIVSPEEFKKILPELKQKNFISSQRNVAQGIYSVDLDYQTNFSNGSKNIFDTLDDINSYANEFYDKTGKDFYFAVTDRDSLGGTQHAIKIIGENPGKFKHLKFIPAVKLTFAHEAPTSLLKFENSEMLIYGINPFEKGLSDFADTRILQRRIMALEFIREINRLYPEFAYDILEFAEQNKLKFFKDYTISNLYWRAREYAETKGGSVIKGEKNTPQKIIDDADAVINSLFDYTLGSFEVYSAIGSKIADETAEFNKSIRKVFTTYSTHYDENKGRVVSFAENLYSDMIDCLKRQKYPPVMAIANTYYLTHYFEPHGNNKSFENVARFIKKIQQNSNNMLIAFESVAPAYNKDNYLSPEAVRKFNSYLRENTNLYEVGGSFYSINNYSFDDRL